MFFGTVTLVKLENLFLCNAPIVSGDYIDLKLLLEIGGKFWQIDSLPQQTCNIKFSVVE